MIVLINGGPALDRFGPSRHVGRLISPRSGNRVDGSIPWAADNDAFGAWDEGRFLRMLARVSGVSGCLFVAAPDVVGDAKATLARFVEWAPAIRFAGLPVALVGQDGAESIPVPWDDLDAWFVGGSTVWKLSAASADLVAEANRRGKWTHMGRVNTRRRLRIARDFGVDSVDGTGWSKFPDVYLRNELPHVAALSRQSLLWEPPDAR